MEELVGYSFYLYQQGILRKPLLYLSDFFRDHRQAYYDKLNAFREKEDIEGWLKFFLEGVIITSEKAVDTARKIIQLREVSVAKVTSLGRSAEKGMLLLNALYRMPILRVKDVEVITSLSNPNALTLVSKFVKLGILKETTGYKRNRVYSYSDYITLFS